MLRRRELLRLAGGAGGAIVVAGAGACAGERRARAGEDAAAEVGDAAAAADAATGERMLTRTIPRSGEVVPVIGMGTWQTFDVGDDAEERAPLAEVLELFFAAGGRVIDSSPMYGRAESVVGELLAARPGGAADAFVATKVWTSGRKAGEEQMKTSMRRLRRERLELMQVHNLLDLKAHLPTLRAWKQAGTFRYIGVTHYQLGAFAELERLVREESLDFVQLPYSVAVRDAEARLLPAAADSGTAVLVMRPFESGDLFAKVRGRPLPDFAADLDCTSWAQLLLKFILGHPAVTCPIPATSKPKHMRDNLRAGFGRLPDPALREKIAGTVLSF